MNVYDVRGQLGELFTLVREGTDADMLILLNHAEPEKYPAPEGSNLSYLLGIRMNDTYFLGIKFYKNEKHGFENKNDKELKMIVMKINFKKGDSYLE